MTRPMAQPIVLPLATIGRLQSSIVAHSQIFWWMQRDLSAAGGREQNAGWR